MKSAKKEILETPVKDLDISDELKLLLTNKGYARLKDILKKKLSHLRDKDGLTIHQELELFTIVEENGLEKWWKEE